MDKETGKFIRSGMVKFDENRFLLNQRMEEYYELDHYRHDHDMLDVGALTKLPDNTLCDENNLEEYRK